MKYIEMIGLYKDKNNKDTNLGVITIWKIIIVEIDLYLLEQIVYLNNYFN